MISPALVMDEKRAYEDKAIKEIEEKMDKEIVSGVSCNSDKAMIAVDHYPVGVRALIQELVKQYRLEGWDAKFSDGMHLEVNLTKFRRNEV